MTGWVALVCATPWFCWFGLCLFLVTSLQLTTSLRPLLDEGSTFFPQEKRFFLEHWQQSIYEELH